MTVQVDPASQKTLQLGVLHLTLHVLPAVQPTLHDDDCASQVNVHFDVAPSQLRQQGSPLQVTLSQWAPAAHVTSSGSEPPGMRLKVQPSQSTRHSRLDATHVDTSHIVPEQA